MSAILEGLVCLNECVKAENLQLNLPLDEAVEATYSEKLANRIDAIIDCNAIDGDTYKVLKKFQKFISETKIRNCEARDYQLGRINIGQLPPGLPCIMQPYIGLRFDIDGKIYLREVRN
ncbi:hypothetical protein HYX08_03825 [Candidatus Woesearchaeota archaeon]|nr:hypothetical protein [Candidatus Woesearchaeota archaeon]